MTQPLIRAQTIFFACAAIIVLAVAALIGFLGLYGLRIFTFTSPIEFFFGTTWDKTAQVFGVVPLLYGTVMTTLIAMVISTPIALGAAIYLAEIAPERIREPLGVVVDMFAAVPSVIFGLIALAVLVPWVRETFNAPLGQGILPAALILVLMVQPTIISIASDALRSVPNSLREGAEALGATRLQMIMRVLLPAARSGLLTAVILGMGRAIGETMAVQMVIGNITSRIPPNLVTGATTMPAAIVTQLPEAALPTQRYALIMVAFLLLCITFGLIVLVRRFSARRA
ncbi:MAG: phosphate ABC transporter permease subunit PstC [Oscillochloridaceae bacterium]|nr:phosphate ABC transporter permease subunit PstC [Chloroflexaceae bacterium]MDW8391368.1 phosphate ABC transporter permease subunit PstC [Oscillochloridaceae bacterium]